VLAGIAGSAILWGAAATGPALALANQELQTALADTNAPSAVLSETASQMLDDTSSNTLTGDLAACPGNCGNPGCPTCRLCPCVYLYAESLFLTRSNESLAQPIIINANGGGTVLATSDLDFNWNTGLRLGGGICLHDGCYLDVAYLGLYDSHALATTAKQDNQYLIFPGDLGQAPNVFNNVNRVRINYDSQLNSFELNLPCCCTWSDGCDGRWQGRSIEWFGGLRYISLNEHLNIAGERDVNHPEPERGAYDLRTMNNLYGMQFGARLRRCYGRLGYEAGAKAGIYGNDAQQRQTLVDFPQYFLPPTDTTARGGHVALASELNLTALYQLTDVWNLRLGYNLMWIEGVALAPDQLDFTNVSTSRSGLNTDGGVLYHGASVGLEARW
jgi:hypothetical protein